MKRLALLAIVACGPAASNAKPAEPARKQEVQADAGFVDMTPAKGADVPSFE